MEKIKEIISSELTKLLKESYLADLYHFTSLGNAYYILKSNCIYGNIPDCEYNCYYDNEDENGISISLTRTKNPKLTQGFCWGANKENGTIVRFTLDTERIMSSLRNAKLKPFNYGYLRNNQNGKIKTRTIKGKKKYYSIAEFEERLFNVNIYKLDQYCKQIDIFIIDDSYTDDNVFDLCSDEAEQICNQQPNLDMDSLSTYLCIKKLLKMRKFRKRIFVHNVNPKYQWIFGRIKNIVK